MFDFNQYKLRFSKIPHVRSILWIKGYSDDYRTNIFIMQDVRVPYCIGGDLQHLTLTGNGTGSIRERRSLSHLFYCKIMYDYYREE